MTQQSHASIGPLVVAAVALSFCASCFFGSSLVTEARAAASPRLRLAAETDTIAPGCICTMEYNPVCGRLADGYLTFSNPCRARCAHAEIVHMGMCGGE